MAFTVVVYQAVLRAVENNKSGGAGGGGLRVGREGLEEKVVLDQRPKEAG